MIKRKGKPAEPSDSAEQAATDAAQTAGIASSRFATKIRIELLETLKSHVRRGCPMDIAVWLAAEACHAEQTPHFKRRALDFLSGEDRYGRMTAADFYRRFAPNVKNGISI